MSVNGVIYFVYTLKEKYPKEKATRLPLASCVPRFRRGLAKGAPAPSPTCGIPAAPLRAIPAESSGTRRGRRDWARTTDWFSSLQLSDYSFPRSTHFYMQATGVQASPQAGRGLQPRP
jgi:hypothetical protein